jgi:hypothetical protein
MMRIVGQSLVQYDRHFDMSTPPTKDPFNLYYGLWSARDRQRVSDLLTSIGVRFQSNEFEAKQDVLENWNAWDVTSPKPNIAYDLWIHDDDREKVDDHIVTMFPERRFQ